MIRLMHLGKKRKHKGGIEPGCERLIKYMEKGKRINKNLREDVLDRSKGRIMENKKKS